VSYDLFADRAFSVAPLRRLLRATSGPAVVVVNFPHNPSGYSPNVDEARAIVQAILEHEGPLVVLVDDAYAGMVHSKDAVRRSLFWDLAEAADPAHHAIFRIDGVTKELLSFSGRVGFLTAALDPSHPAAEALESKLKSLARSSVGSPAGPTQALILHALQQPDLEDQIAAANAELAERFHILRDALDKVDGGLLEVYPCNSGVFSMIKLPDSLDAETLRRRLIDQQSLGLVSEPEMNALRIAYCSVARDDLPELVRRLAAGIQDALDDQHHA
jgi:aspartate/methionine/tyrosine aminotransferase